MELKFQTKEESNLQQEEEFIKLSKAERVWRFFELMQKNKALPRKSLVKESKNFLIHIQLP